MSELKTIYVDHVDNIEVVLTTAPKTLPVDVKFMKDYMKVSTDQDDELIGLLISSAVDQVERFTGRALMPRTLTAKFWGAEHWKELPIIPANAINTVKYFDQEDVETVYTSIQYQVSGGSNDKSVAVPKTMVISHGKALGHTEIEYVAGYESENKIPDDLLETIWLLVSMSYQMREVLNEQCISIGSQPVLKQRLFNYQKTYL